MIWCVAGAILLSVSNDKNIFITININHNSILDIVMYYMTYLGEGLMITGVLLVLWSVNVFRNTWYFITATLCNGLAPLISQVIKRSIAAPRPLSVFHDAGWIHMEASWDKLYHNSFPSGHTTGAFCMFCFLSFMLPPKMKWIGTIFLLLAIVVGYSRIYLAAHFFTDIYGGSIIGVTTTLLMFTMMSQYKTRFFDKQAAKAISGN